MTNAELAVANAVYTTAQIATTDQTNAGLLAGIRMIWQAGHERWGWPPLGVDQPPTLDQIAALTPKRRPYTRRQPAP